MRCPFHWLIGNLLCDAISIKLPVADMETPDLVNAEFHSAAATSRAVEIGEPPIIDLLALLAV